MKKVLVTVSSFLLPVIAFAAYTPDTGYVSNLLNTARTIMGWLIPLIIGAAVLVIIWGIFRYIISGADEEKRKEAKQFIVWGIIGVVLMLSVWGLVEVVKSFFFGGAVLNTAPANLPQLPGSSI